MFHLRDGLYFERLPDHQVRILKRESGHDDAPAVFDITVDKDSWCSVIATMSYYGEEDSGFYRAGKFHYGAPYHDNKSWSMTQHIADREAALLELQNVQ